MARTTHITDRVDEGTGDVEALEGRIDAVLCWGRVLQHLGASSNRIDGGDVSVIGEALDTLAGLMIEDYRALTQRSARP